MGVLSIAVRGSLGICTRGSGTIVFSVVGLALFLASVFGCHEVVSYVGYSLLDGCLAVKVYVPRDRLSCLLSQDHVRSVFRDSDGRYYLYATCKVLGLALRHLPCHSSYATRCHLLDNGDAGGGLGLSCFASSRVLVRVVPCVGSETPCVSF
jgi:hypothetical protein